MKKLILFFFVILLDPDVSAVISGGYCSLEGCSMQGDINMNNNSLYNATINNVTYTQTGESDPVWISEKSGYLIIGQADKNCTNDLACPPITYDSETVNWIKSFTGLWNFADNATPHYIEIRTSIDDNASYFNKSMEEYVVKNYLNKSSAGANISIVGGIISVATTFVADLKSYFDTIYATISSLTNYTKTPDLNDTIQRGKCVENTSDVNFNNADIDNANITNLTSQTLYDVSSQGLVLAMNFNNASVDGTTIIDSSEMNNHGTNVGALHNPIGGFNDGGAFVFDGLNDYISVPNDASLNFGANTDFTISVWLKSTQVTEGSVITKGGTGNNYYDYTMNVNKVRMVVRDGSTFKIIAGNKIINDGIWHHTVITLDRDGDGIIYVDGVFDVSEDISGIGDIDDATKPLVIGVRSNDLSSWPFNGTIDEVRIYNRVLSSEDVGRLYNQRTEINDPYVDKKDFTCDSDGNCNVTGNITADNAFLPQYLFAHTNETIKIKGANEWTNVTFIQEETDLKQGITHTHNDNTNTTFTINKDGIYDIDYDYDVIDKSASSTDIDVAGRTIYSNGTEISGSVFETDITKKDIETEVSHDFLARLKKGDKLIFQFTATDADVEISTHGTFGEHPESATVRIMKISNLP